MKYDNQLRYAATIISAYDGNIPLSLWLKDFFRANKQMGSRDRKTLAEMVYGFYRLGHLPFENIEKRILAGVYAGNVLDEMIAYFKLAEDDDRHLQLRQVAAGGELTEDIRGNIFPWKELLSAGIDRDAFESSFLQKPDLFLRIRPGKETQVLKKLKASDISWQYYDDPCLALPPSTKVDAVLEIDREVVVQDRSSQKAAAFINEIPFTVASVWDCCAASGGKSIMAYDLLKNIELTVSDIRSSILYNLGQRFKRAGIVRYKSFVTDLTRAEARRGVPVDDPDNVSAGNALPEDKYDLVIADVPCTGSGTWARTPEQLYFFKEEKLAHYTDLQEKILSRIVPAVKPGGALLYITCSVFAQENENRVQWLLDRFNLRLVKSELIKGYEHRADTMFAALFVK